MSLQEKKNIPTLEFLSRILRWNICLRCARITKKPDRLRSNNLASTARYSPRRGLHRHRLELWKALLDHQRHRLESWFAFPIKFPSISIVVFSCRYSKQLFSMSKGLCFGAALRQKKNSLFTCLVLIFWSVTWVRCTHEIFAICAGSPLSLWSGLLWFCFPGKLSCVTFPRDQPVSKESAFLQAVFLVHFSHALVNSKPSTSWVDLKLKYCSYLLHILSFLILMLSWRSQEISKLVKTFSLPTN